MTDQEINERLALAIGYEPKDVRVVGRVCGVRRHSTRIDGSKVYGYWTVFRYSSPLTIWPICVVFNKWPWQEWKHGAYTGRWFVQMPDGPCTGVVEADCPAKAVALAVISEME